MNKKLKTVIIYIVAFIVGMFILRPAVFRLLQTLNGKP
jgi:flagellar biosynthesis/type III secretory pathway M-ring protein FliF/YscJ